MNLKITENKITYNIRSSILSSKAIYLMIAFFAMVIIHFLPLPDGIKMKDSIVQLTAEGKDAIAILFLAIFCWITESIPIPVTGLVVMILIPFFKLASFSETVALGFGNYIILFFIGILILSSAITSSGLTQRFALFAISKVGINTERILFVFLLTGAMISMWVTNVAVAAILLPIAMGIIKKIGAQPMKSNFGRNLMFATAWAPFIGGVATPAGNATNILGINFLKEFAHIDIGFLKWMMIGAPISFIMLPIAWFVLIKFYPHEIKEMPGGIESIRDDLEELGPISSMEKKTLFIFCMAITLWIGDPLIKMIFGRSIPIAAVAVLTAILLFIPGMNVITWKQVEKGIDWGSIILIAAGLALGMVIYNTGAAKWMAVLCLKNIGSLSEMVRIFVVVMVVAILHVGFSSNTVTAIVIVPLMVALAGDLGLNPWLMAGPAIFTTSMAFLLVTSSPTSIIPYSTGFFSMYQYTRIGILLTFLAALCITFSFVIFGSFIN